jgi:peptidoglycan/LPS O-acetylase OafA/YrhL
MDAWRSIAALLVVISHARDIVMQPYGGSLTLAPFYAVTGFGHSAVVLFFVLSGFWISRTALARIERSDFWRGYLVDRLTRLLIVLGPAVVLGGALDWIGLRWLDLPIYHGQTGALSLPEDTASRLTLAIGLGNLVFLQTIAVPPFGTNGPLWSLAWEFWFYLWFAALAWLMLRKRLSLVLLSLPVGLLNPSIVGGFAAWLAGFCLLLAIERWPLSQITPGHRSRLTMVAVTAVFLAVLVTSRRSDSQLFDFLLAVSFAALLFTAHRSALTFPALLGGLARFGRSSSFSLYVIHFPLLAFVGGMVTQQERMDPDLAGITVTLALTGLCVAAAWIFSRFTERQTGSVRRWVNLRIDRAKAALLRGS